VRAETPRSAGSARGWLLLLCGWLAIWQPLNFAAAAAEWIAALPVRGWPLGILLAVRLAVTAVGLAAARALWDCHDGARALARAAVLLSAAFQLVVYATAIAPNNRVPGDTPVYVSVTVLVHGGWLLYLTRSTRAREL
jgi:hypothetical protein